MCLLKIIFGALVLAAFFYTIFYFLISANNECVADMNTYPYTLDKGASLSRVFRLFRMMGLRHIVVVNKFNSVVGMICSAIH